MSSDYKDLLRLLAEYSVRYLVIGGYAVMEYAEPRYTKDLDLLIATDPTNAEAVYNALKRFGAPLSGVSAEDFANQELFYQMGSPPLRVDILMSIPGVNFERAWADRRLTELFGVTVPVISKAHLIESTRASGRTTDMADIEALESAPDLE